MAAEGSIINIQHYTDALRNTGYKNTESAIAEIVDNSIEADAKNVLIICKEGVDRGRGKKRVQEIAILDNGTGMDPETLRKSLVIGDGTRRARKGMGRFGVGLPQASLHVAPRVEVYSWQNGSRPRMVYLDIEKIKAGKQTTIEEPVEGPVPKDYQRYLKDFELRMERMHFSRSGTLVIWRNCDRLNPKTVTPLFVRFDKLLGRKFRHFINEGCSIGITVSGDDRARGRLLKPNDPLYLMEHNQILGDRSSSNPGDPVEDGEEIFELWNNGDVLGVVNEEITYLRNGDRVTAPIEIKFSIAKPKYHGAGGESKIGKHCATNVGISVVRANREVDFGKFDFFSDVNEPRHRWWGCEIRFSPELDEVFGVANNKQQVELFQVDAAEYSDADAEDKPVWLLLNKIIASEIKTMMKVIVERKAGTRQPAPQQSTEEQVVSIVEQDNPTSTSSSHHKDKTSPEEREAQAKERLIDEGNPTPTNEEIQAVLKPTIRLESRDLGELGPFIEISPKMGNCWLTINTGTKFYSDIYSKLDEWDESVKRAFNLVLMAFARAEDEAFSNPTLYEAFKDVRQQWSNKIRKYLNTDYQP